MRVTTAIALVIAGAWLLYTLRRLLLILFAGAVLAAGLARIAGRLERTGVPRPVARLIPPVAFAASAVGLALAIAAPLAAEAESLVQRVRAAGEVPALRDVLLDAVALARHHVPALAPLEDELAGAAHQVADQVTGGRTPESGPSPLLTRAARAAASGVGAVFSLLFAFVIALYLLWDGERVRYYLLSLVPAPHRQTTAALLDRASERIGGWVLGQAAICAIVGVTTFITLSLIGVPFALVLALVAAAAELVPLIGPVAAAALGVAAAASQSLPQALATLVFYLVFQQIDSYVVAPRVLGAAVRIHPLAVLVAVGVGAEVAGIAGALLAPPAATAAAVLLDEWRRRAG